MIGQQVPARTAEHHGPPPDHSIATLKARYGERYRWLLLLSVMVGTMASIMSSTIINVAIPDMSQHFTLGQARAQWVTSGFMAAMTVSMLTTPWLLSRYGYRRTYSGCMWLLLVGGVAGGFANDFAAGAGRPRGRRPGGGRGAAHPAIIILRAFEPHEQGRASGIFGMGVVLAPALGPSLGGLLVDGFGWRSIFFMVVPFCIASLWMAQRFVPPLRQAAGPPTRRAPRWTGAACCWPQRARCACSTGWSSCKPAPPPAPLRAAGRRGADAGGLCGAAAAHAEGPPAPS
jgi:MFS family permease